VAMARSLRLNVIAEGVETVEQLNYLKSLHCDEAQGYHFSKPLPADKFEAYLLQQDTIPAQKTALIAKSSGKS
jgi:EAL domain-containing protein (putative c-di-GMP-specific phosphodiesterase class I)